MERQPFDEAFDSVKTLAARFEASEPRYLSGQYNEAEARKDFIDKFFIALGWDVNHDHQTNPYAQEVKVERTGGLSQRRADYAFYLAPNFRDVRFYVEAKKPLGDIATPDNYFQAIRYGYGSGNPLVVVTDFRHFHVLDCRYRPDIGTATYRAVAKYHYSQYSSQEEFSKIYWLFSHEAVASGSIEKFAETLPKPRGKSVQRALFPGTYKPADESLLEELDEYRKTLAQAFKSRNAQLDSETLTEITQRTIDRLVFLRFLEDKQIEVPSIVDKLGSGGTPWEDFISASRRLDGIYNGVVFKKHDILDAPSFRADEHSFADICERLSYTNSAYNFDAIPIHILGSIYERFLGKVIVATDKRASVVEKLAVRKAGGVYYTPEYIVRYIVENTVAKLIGGKTPVQIAEMRFADIACGSGSFLLGIYDLLLRRHGNYYNANPKKARKGDCIERDGKLYLSLQKKREILLNNIYGVDIDAQAVEVCQLSLYLRLLQDETIGSAHQYLLEFQHAAHLRRLLPDLSRNVVCGNSLIGTEILDVQRLAGDEERKLSPMNFRDVFPAIMKRGGFDAIIGNPPYGMISDPLLKAYFGTHYLATEGRIDTFELFIERATQLCRTRGLVGYIVPNPLLSNLFARRLRRYILDSYSIEDLTNFGFDVFADPTIHTCIIILARGSRPNTMVKVRKQVMSEDALHEPYDYEVPQEQLKQNPNSVFDIFADPETFTLLRKLSSVGQPLGDFCFIRQCIKTGNDKRYVQSASHPPGKHWVPSLRGKSIERYFTGEKDLFVNYGPWLARNWANKSFYEVPKIAIRETGSRITATLDLEHRYFLSSLYAIYPKSASEEPSLHYLLAVLNSSVATYFVRKVALELTKGAFTKLRTNQLARLPVPHINISDPVQNGTHGRIVRAVTAMLESKEQLAKVKTDKDKAYYKNKCHGLDRQIDRLVYDLYALSEKEIGIIESRVGEHALTAASKSNPRARSQMTSTPTVELN